MKHNVCDGSVYALVSSPTGHFCVNVIFSSCPAEVKLYTENQDSIQPDKILRCFLCALFCPVHLVPFTKKSEITKESPIVSTITNKETEDTVTAPCLHSSGLDSRSCSFLIEL